MIHRGSPPFLETPVTGDQSQPVIVMFGRTNIQLDQLWLWVPFGWRKQPISSAIWFFLHCQYCQLADHIGQEWLYPLRWHKLNILNQHCSILPMWSRIIDNMGSTTSLDLIIPIISCSMKKNGIPQYRKKLIPSSISDILSEDYSHMIYYAIPILFLYIYISDIYYPISSHCFPRSIFVYFLGSSQRTKLLQWLSRIPDPDHGSWILPWQNDGRKKYIWDFHHHHHMYIHICI